MFRKTIITAAGLAALTATGAMAQTVYSNTTTTTTTTGAGSATVIERKQVDDEDAGRNGGAGALAGAATGAVVGGPVGAVVGGAIGLAGGVLATDASEETITYVQQNPVAPATALGADVVVGAAVPETVVLTPVPETTYAYVYTDTNTPVLVDPETRTVVQVLQ